MATKTKTVFVCQQCGARHPKWLGRCPSCEAWDSLVEESAGPKVDTRRETGTAPVRIPDIQSSQKQRKPSGLCEFDRVLGGGVVDGSLILIGGEPGIGKSTLLLQVAGHFSLGKGRVLYVSGEESGRQIKLRADRLGIKGNEILVLSEIELDLIEQQIRTQKPDLVIVDSIQTVHHPDFASAPGSVGQVRECASRFQVLSKKLGLPVFLVGHVTKEGSIAGPRVLEHIVDTVLYFEGDSHHAHRLLRTVKNRFGAANEVAVFAMHETGLEEVANPSEVFLAGRMKGVSGSVAVCVVEGTRSLLVELQALVGKAHYGMPQRVTSGIDGRRLSLLLAVLEKTEGMPLGVNDVFVNVVGGLRVDEPGLDLGIVCAAVSSFLNIPMPETVCAMGEVGLGGEVRPISKVAERVKEAVRLGFREILLPAKSVEAVKPSSGVLVTGIHTVHEAVQWLRDNRKS